MLTEKIIKLEFTEAESNLEFCWKVLVDIKALSNLNNNEVSRIFDFQDKLALTIFRLQSIRTDIIAEEKKYVTNKIKYDFDWFIAKMRRLSKYKDGIDTIVDMAKALGDAYAYFFYQSDLELLEGHLSHQRIINHNAGIGERGELEFIKQVKQVDGHFTLIHGITNILRYGDFSFIDVKTMKVTKIGELKTKKVDEETLKLQLFILKRDKLTSHTKSLKNPTEEPNRKKRQLLGIAHLLNKKESPLKSDKMLLTKSYFEEIEALLKKRSINKVHFKQVSSGLAFACVKFKKNTLFKKTCGQIVKKDLSNEISDTISKLTPCLIKSGSQNNSIVLGQLVYSPDKTDKNTSGTIPLFWYPIKTTLLKQLYFYDCLVMSIFNPIHLIEEIENMGFVVKSNFSKKPLLNDPPAKKIVYQFDFFISYIINYLLNESFVLDSIKEAEEFQFNKKTNLITIKPSLQINIHNDCR